MKSLSIFHYSGNTCAQNLVILITPALAVLRVPSDLVSRSDAVHNLINPHGNPMQE
jgi:hypothetical protein